MSSTTHSALCATELSSADISDKVRRRLVWWVERPAEHARFLNTLAMLEHIGSRKIMVSQTRGELSQEVLKHLAEETRHAFFFKRAAEKLARRPMHFDACDTIRPASARMYFGRLDAAVSAGLGADVCGEAPYLFVSLIIELRAIWAYRLYNEVLTARPGGLSLKSVLAEEELHLVQMDRRLQELGAEPERHIPAFAAVEDRLFRSFWAQIEASLEALPQAA